MFKKLFNADSNVSVNNTALIGLYIDKLDTLRDSLYFYKPKSSEEKEQKTIVSNEIIALKESFQSFCFGNNDVNKLSNLLTYTDGLYDALKVDLKL